MVIMVGVFGSADVEEPVRWVQA